MVVLQPKRTDKEFFIEKQSKVISPFARQGTARVCTVPKTKRGYGFQLKGLREIKEEFSPSVEAPCSQLVRIVSKDSAAHEAGVLSNDFIDKVRHQN